MLITQIAGDTSSTYVQENGAGINYVRTNDAGMTFKDARATGTIATAVGYNAYASGEQSLAVGPNSIADDDFSTAIGAQAKAFGHHSLALGAGSNTASDASIALGANSFATGAQSMSLGVASKTSAEAAIALGYNSFANGLNSMSLGQSSYAGKDNSVALGSDASADGLNSVALGAGSIAEDDNTVSVGSSTLQRKVVNMAAGIVSQTSTDAINGSQLYSLSSNIANYFGGDASVSDDGVFTCPTYNINGTDYTNVGDALAAIDTSFEDALLWDENANGGTGAFSASHGKNDSKITNVLAGAVTETSTDAINSGQLHSLSSNIANYFGGMLLWVMTVRLPARPITLTALTTLMSVMPWPPLTPRLKMLCCGMKMQTAALGPSAPAMVKMTAKSPTFWLARSQKPALMPLTAASFTA